MVAGVSLGDEAGVGVNTVSGTVGDENCRVAEPPLSHI